MLNTNITNFRKNIFELLEQTIHYNVPVNISTKAGNAVLISEEDYNSLMETLYLSVFPLPFFPCCFCLSVSFRRICSLSWLPDKFRVL